MQKIGGAVERVDDEAMGAVGAFDLAALLEQETVAGPRANELVVQDLLGASVGGGDEIGRAFQRDLELLDLAEVAREAAAGLAGGAEHHVHQGRGRHGVPPCISRHAGASPESLRAVNIEWVAILDTGFRRYERRLRSLCYSARRT